MDLSLNKKIAFKIGLLVFLLVFFPTIRKGISQEENENYVVWEYQTYITDISDDNYNNATCIGCHFDISYFFMYHDEEFQIKIVDLEIGNRYIVYLGDDLIRIIERFDNSSPEFIFSIRQEKVGMQRLWIGDLINTTKTELQIIYDFKVLDIFELEVKQGNFINKNFESISIFIISFGTLAVLVTVIYANHIKKQQIISKKEEEREFPRGFCVNCNYQNENQDKFCMKCGYEFN